MHYNENNRDGERLEKWREKIVSDLNEKREQKEGGSTAKMRVVGREVGKRNTGDRVGSPFKYFKWSEFDCNSGKAKGIDNMNFEFVTLLDKAREIAGIPFKVNSGFRTPEYNIELAKRGFKVAKNSPHMKGMAADISTTTSRQRYKVMSALMEVGFKRIGIGEGFIHCDNDGSKSQDIIWTYY